MFSRCALNSACIISTLPLSALCFHVDCHNPLQLTIAAVKDSLAVSQKRATGHCHLLHSSSSQGMVLFVFSCKLGRLRRPAGRLSSSSSRKAWLFHLNDHLSFRPQGMVFFAFGFNLVDCGGLLGGRLDSGDSKLPAKKVLELLKNMQCCSRPRVLTYNPPLLAAATQSVVTVC